MANVGKQVGAGMTRGRAGLVGVVLAAVAVVGLVAGIVLTRGSGGSGAQASGGATTSKAGTPQTDVTPVGEGGLLKPALQCPGRKVRTVELDGKGSTKDTPTDIARRWLAGKGDGQPKGVKPSTFRVIVPGGAGSTTAKQGYLMLLDRDDITVALLDIRRAGGGWVARSASTCA